MATHTIKFSTDVAHNSTAIAGWTFTKTGNAPQGPIGPDAANIQGDIVAFDITWTIDPIAGDVVTASYNSGIGTYYKAGGDPVDDAMESATLTLVNCSPQPAPAPGPDIPDPYTGIVTWGGSNAYSQPLNTLQYGDWTDPVTSGISPISNCSGVSQNTTDLFRGRNTTTVGITASTDRVEIGITSNALQMTDALWNLKVTGLGLAIKTTANVTEARLLITDDGYNNLHWATANKIVTDQDGWQIFSNPGNAPGVWNTFGSPTETNNLRQWKLRLYTTDTDDIHIALCGLAPQPTPVVIHTNDDGNDECYSYLWPATTSRDLPASLSVYPDAFDTAGRLTTAQFTEIVADPLMEGTNHNWTVSNAGDIGNYPYYREVIQCQEYLESFDAEASRMHVWPNGVHNATVDGLLNGYPMFCARQVEGSNQSSNSWWRAQEGNADGSNRTQMMALPKTVDLSTTDPLAQAKTYINNAIGTSSAEASEGLWNDAFIMSHKFGAVADGLTYTESDMNDLLDWLAAKVSLNEIEMKLFSDWYRDVGWQPVGVAAAMTGPEYFEAYGYPTTAPDFIVTDAAGLVTAVATGGHIRIDSSFSLTEQIMVTVPGTVIWSENQVTLTLGAFRFRLGSSTELLGINLNGATGTVSVHILDGQITSNVKIACCSITASNSYGVYIGQTGVGGRHNDITLERCRIAGQVYGLYNIHAKNVTVDHNHITNCVRGIQHEGGTNHVVTYNHVDGGVVGILMLPNSNVGIEPIINPLIAFNHVINQTEEAIGLDCNAAAASSTSILDQFTINSISGDATAPVLNVDRVSVRAIAQYIQVCIGVMAGRAYKIASQVDAGTTINITLDAIPSDEFDLLEAGDTINMAHIIDGAVVHSNLVDVTDTDASGISLWGGVHAADIYNNTVIHNNPPGNDPAGSLDCSIRLASLAGVVAEDDPDNNSKTAQNITPVGYCRVWSNYIRGYVFSHGHTFDPASPVVAGAPLYRNYISGNKASVEALAWQSAGTWIGSPVDDDTDWTNQPGI